MIAADAASAVIGGNVVAEDVKGDIAEVDANGCNVVDEDDTMAWIGCFDTEGGGSGIAFGDGV